MALEVGPFLAEIANQFGGRADDGNCPGIVTGLNILRVGLVNIAKRAMELNDSALLAELEHLGVIHPNGKECRAAIAKAKPS